MTNNETEIQVASADTLATLNKSEIDQQIATAHQFPRSIKQFRDEASQLVALNESVAGECVYSLPRAGKNIEGPSARFAEIMIHSWGNCRAGARVVQEDTDFVTAQGIFHDLEKNSAITYEVKRRIVDKNGFRFKPDMVAVTANAACSIALRNAALKGIPKALWSMMYEQARQVVMGDVQTLANRRAEMLQFMQRYGVTEEIVCKFLDVKGVDDITLEMMVMLRGLANSLKTGETTVEKIVAELNGDGAQLDPVSSPETKELNEELKTKAKSKAKSKPKEEPKKEPASSDDSDGSDGSPGFTLDQLMKIAADANSLDGLDEVQDMISGLALAQDEDTGELTALIEERRAELEKAAK